MHLHDHMVHTNQWFCLSGELGLMYTPATADSHLNTTQLKDHLGAAPHEHACEPGEPGLEVAAHKY